MQKDLMSLADLSGAELWSWLDLAIRLKAELRAGGNKPVLKTKSLAMIFQKPSLRTRVSFEMGMLQLGGHAIYLSPDEIRLGKRESIPDVARVLSRYVNGIMARVFGHDDVVTLGRWATVPVINGLSDFTHPCQGLTDLLTIREKLGGLAGVKLAYVGDGNNVLNSLLYGAAKTGMHLTAATPKGYEPSPTVLHQARIMAMETQSVIQVIRDPREAVADADVVYTDTWTSMGQEAEAEARRKVFPPYQVNQSLLAVAKVGAGVMHDLPAHRGEEITDDVADGPRSWIFDQAENRLHAQKAILVSLLAR
jgi:ornithine carbamoyltransferase